MIFILALPGLLHVPRVPGHFGNTIKYSSYVLSMATTKRIVLRVRYMRYLRYLLHVWVIFILILTTLPPVPRVPGQFKDSDKCSSWASLLSATYYPVSNSAVRAVYAVPSVSVACISTVYAPTGSPVTCTTRAGLIYQL